MKGDIELACVLRGKWLRAKWFDRNTARAHSSDVLKRERNTVSFRDETPGKTVGSLSSARRPMEIRKARQADIMAMCAVDHVARVDKRRRQFIRDSVRHGIAYVAMAGGQVCGYSVLEHSFFGRGFISMLMVDPDHRSAGVGSALVRYVEGLCRSDRIFTSTNQSNLPMQALLQKLGYTRSGIVHDLDPGDPEVFYNRTLDQERRK